MIRYLFLLLFLVACGPAGDQNLYRLHHYANQFDPRYQITINESTPKGINVDTSGLPIDLASIDAQTDHVEACLADAFGSPPKINDDVRAQNDCDSSTFPLALHRSWIFIKVAPDATLSFDETNEVLPQIAPNDQLCYDKKMCLDDMGQPIEACHCRWRAGIQDNKIIIVTPSMYLYPDALIRFVTGCNRPWVGVLAECARPTVSPLSGLVTKKE